MVSESFEEHLRQGCIEGWRESVGRMGEEGCDVRIDIGEGFDDSAVIRSARRDLGIENCRVW